MKNLILINLTEFKKIELEQIEKFYNLRPESLLENKIKAIGKIWIDLELNTITAYTIENEMDKIIISEFYIEALSKIKNIELPNLKPVNPFINLDIDSILDKIINSGIESLTSEELLFLKNNK